MALKQATRAFLRARALDLASGVEAAAGVTDRAFAEPRVTFLYLHAVPASELSVLRALVDMLARDHDLVSYSEAVALAQRGPITRPTVALSFDDGFVSNVAAARVLEEMGVRACFFVPVGFIGCATVNEARSYFGMVAGVDEPAMTWSDLEGLVHRGHEIGNHTMTHRVLSSLTPAEAAEDVGRAREVLGARLGEGEHFAWPRGRWRDMTAEAARHVFDTGHLSCASAQRGMHRSVVGRRGCIRRDHLMTSWPLRHLAHFVARSPEVIEPWPTGWDVA